MWEAGGAEGDAGWVEVRVYLDILMANREIMTRSQSGSFDTNRVNCKKNRK